MHVLDLACPSANLPAAGILVGLMAIMEEEAMELEFDSDQEELRASVRAVLARECPMSLVREIVEIGIVAEPLWRRMCQLDWPALTIPQDNGGMGLGAVELAVLAEELGRVVAPGPLLSTVAFFVPAVREAGTKEQLDRFLRPIATSGCTGALAVAERHGGWERSEMEASATRREDGWVLSGQKRFVLEGCRAEQIVVAARVVEPKLGPDAHGSSGIGLFVVDREAVDVEQVETLDASRCMAEMDLKGVRVGPDRMLNGTSDGGAALERALEEATAAVSLEMVGACSSILEIALQYAKDREQFGVKIGSFQAMKHKFADMFVALEAARAACYFAVAAIAEDDPRRSIAASMAKALAGDCERLICQEGIQILGGIGYTWEHDMHLYVKRAMSDASLLGTAEQHRRRVADLLGLSRSSP